jgi:hypothetical protein
MMRTMNSNGRHHEDNRDGVGTVAELAGKGLELLLELVSTLLEGLALF